MAKKPKHEPKPEIEGTESIAGKSPKQKHFGRLGETMRKAHNTKRMDYVRSHKDD